MKINNITFHLILQVTLAAMSITMSNTKTNKNEISIITLHLTMVLALTND